MATRTVMLDKDDIRAWVGDASYQRGRPYARDGSLSHLRRQGDTLKALCQGTLPQPYRVEATLGPDGIEESECSCPVGAGGYCKHVAAMLLAWLDDPDAFREVEDLETTLKRRTKAELIALIGSMIARDPELESLLELPMPTGRGKARTIDEEAIRRQVDDAIARAGYEWGAAWTAAQNLDDLVKLGDDYAASGHWTNAATVYRVVALETLDQYNMLHDEEGALHEVVNNCVVGLGRCMAETTDPRGREKILRTWFDIDRWDVNFGGIDMGADAPKLILEHATPEERHKVAGWVREALASDDPDYSGFRHQRHGGFLLKLEGDELDEETALQICRETGRRGDLVDRLLKLGRLDEAIAEARSAGDYDLLHLADLFESQGHPQEAEQLIRDRMGRSTDRRLKEWLKDRLRNRGDVAEALSLAEQLFWERPSLPGYRDLKELAGAIDRWGPLRKRLLTRLSKENRHDLVTEIHLEEGELDPALKSLKKVPKPTAMWGWGLTGLGRSNLSMQVARAAEDQRPDAAIALYMEEVQRLIDMRGRGFYADAAELLLRVRKLYRRKKDETGWKALITRIRDQNRTLRALKDELNKAGL